MTAFPSARRTEAGVRASTLAEYRSTLVLIGVALVVFGLGFRRDVSAAVGVWIESTAYNHCFVVLPLVGYLLWERRSVFEEVSPRPALWPLLLMLPLSAAWFVAAALDINEGRQLLVVAMFQVVLLTALGLRMYRLLLAPLLFLFFLVPSGAFLVPRLQTVTTDFTMVGLRLLQIPAFSDGYLIEIPAGRFEIAEACAGLRFLIAAVMFSCLFAIVMYRGWLRRGFYIALSIAVAIVANGMRALGILLYAQISGSAEAAAADHVLYGWLFFSIVIALLIGIGMLFAETLPQPAYVAPALSERPAPRWHILAVPLAALLAVSGPSYAGWRNSLVPDMPLPDRDSPEVAAPWQARADKPTDWRPVVSGADREYLESFDAAGSAGVTRYIALYRLRATGNRMTRSNNRVADDNQWRTGPQGRVQVEEAGRTVTVTSTELVHGSHRGLVWSFYVVDGNIAAGLLETKLLQLRSALHRAPSVGALVMLETNADDGTSSAERELRRFWAASRPLAEYVGGLH